MPVYNLAPLWGPTLLTVDGQEASQFAQTSGEMEVCADLVSNYPWLFNVELEEVEKEKKMLEVLEKINFPTGQEVRRHKDVDLHRVADIGRLCQSGGQAGAHGRRGAEASSYRGQVGARSAGQTSST